MAKAFHGLTDTLVETRSPVESTSNRWQVVGDRSTLVHLLNKGFALHEDVGNRLEVLSVKLKKSDVLALKLILNNRSGQETLK